MAVEIRCYWDFCNAIIARLYHEYIGIRFYYMKSISDQFVDLVVMPQ